jgi:hypothetical protein
VVGAHARGERRRRVLDRSGVPRGATTPNQVFTSKAGSPASAAVGISGAVAGFVLFRIFDVFKPYPAGRLEKLHGGLGVMADDAMAAVYANLSLRVLLWLLPAWIA